MKFSHTPLTAAKAIRALVEDDIPLTLEDIFGRCSFSGRWTNAHKVFCLVQEQCNGLPSVAGMKPHSGPIYTGHEIQMAIQQVFPELFADYVEKLFEAEKSTLL